MADEETGSGAEAGGDAGVSACAGEGGGGGVDGRVDGEVDGEVDGGADGGVGREEATGPVGHVERLLSRVSNPYEIGDDVLGRLETALMVHTGMHTLRECKGPPRSMGRRTYRHGYLLADGSSQVLWEVEHDTGPDERTLYEVYGDQESLDRAQNAIDARIGGPPPGWPEVELDLAEWLKTAIVITPLEGRAYTEGHSAEHAERVLRRAENVTDAPGEELRARLRLAFAHQITFVRRRHQRVQGREVGWTLYEHAFLLADGEEVSLWELEHNMAPGGVPVCEVYADQAVACDAADLRLEAF